jgi:hypothetical protein
MQAPSEWIWIAVLIINAVLYGTGLQLIWRAKDSQIAALREWSPQQLRDTAKASIEIYADYAKQLEAKIAAKEAPPDATEVLGRIQELVKGLKLITSDDIQAAAERFSGELTPEVRKTLLAQYGLDYTALPRVGFPTVLMAPRSKRPPPES